MTAEQEVAALSVEELLERWRRATGDGGDPAAAGAPDARPPASYEQEGMWFAQQLRGERNASYVVRHAYELDGPLDVAALSAAWQGVVRRHAPLRTTFAVTGGGLTQVVHETPPPPLTAEPVAAGEALRARMTEVFREPFDLTAGPVVRARLFRTAPDRHVLFLVIHHIAVDGWSMDVLHRDLETLYAHPSAALPPPAVEFAGHARAQRRAYAGDAAEHVLPYWRERLAGAPPTIDLPADRARAGAPAFASRRISAVVPGDVVARVGDCATRTRSSSFMVLMAAFAAALGQWTGRHDLVLGSATANRDTVESEQLVGCFAGVVPLRLAADPDETFAALVAGVRTALLDAAEHRIPYERLLRDLAIDPRTALSPLFPVVVASHHGFGRPLRLRGLEVRYAEPEDLDCPQDLTVYLCPAEAGMAIHVDYATDLFDASTVEGFVAGYLTLLRDAATRPDAPVVRVFEPPRAVPAGPVPAEPARTDAAPDPRTAHAARVTAEVWAEVLGVPAGADDNFFLLGGNSLAALHVAARLAERLGAEIPLRLIYEFSDLDEFAYELTASGHVGEEPGGAST